MFKLDVSKLIPQISHNVRLCSLCTQCIVYVFSSIQIGKMSVVLFLFKVIYYFMIYFMNAHKITKNNYFESNINARIGVIVY